VRFGIFVIMAGREAGGPETYELELVRAFAALEQQHEYHIFCTHAAAAESFRLRQANVHYHVLWPSLRWVSLLTSLPLVIGRSGLDMLHATFVPPPWSPTAYVFTVHDISMFLHPEFYPAAVRWRMNRLILQGIRKARRILCISEHARDHVAEHFHIAADRLAVVHHGVGTQFHPIPPAQRQPVLTTYGIHAPYVLHVGKLQARKNIVRLLHAFHQFRHAIQSDVKLVLAGRGTWTSPDIVDTMARLHLRDYVIELGHVDADDLPALYSGARMLAFPSLLEGFGLPVIEAMACGTPVLTSNVSCLPEIAGNAALLVNPYSVSDLADGMYRIFTDMPLRETLLARGLERAQAFSWRQTARQTLAVYQQAADS
jgi:glycosyltransferase involved in cell wall biosynthesis